MGYAICNECGAVVMCKTGKTGHFHDLHHSDVLTITKGSAPSDTCKGSLRLYGREMVARDRGITKGVPAGLEPRVH